MESYKWFVMGKKGTVEMFLTRDDRFTSFLWKARVFDTELTATNYMKSGPFFGNVHPKLFEGQGKGNTWLECSFPGYKFSVVKKFKINEGNSNAQILSYNVEEDGDVRKRNSGFFGKIRNFFSKASK
jgi:hypothetical protein